MEMESGWAREHAFLIGPHNSTGLCNLLLILKISHVETCPTSEMEEDSNQRGCTTLYSVA